MSKKGVKTCLYLDILLKIIFKGWNARKKSFIAVRFKDLTDAWFESFWNCFHYLYRKLVQWNETLLAWKALILSVLKLSQFWRIKRKSAMLRSFILLSSRFKRILVEKNHHAVIEFHAVQYPCKSDKISQAPRACRKWENRMAFEIVWNFLKENWIKSTLNVPQAILPTKI